MYRRACLRDGVVLMMPSDRLMLVMAMSADHRDVSCSCATQRQCRVTLIQRQVKHLIPEHRCAGRISYSNQQSCYQLKIARLTKYKTYPKKISPTLMDETENLRI